MDNSGKLISCKACNAQGTGNFCSACGEPYAVHRITIKHVLHEVIHLFTHFENGLAFTLKQLIVKPGYTQKSYISGVRSPYQKPFSLFFLCGTITALALYFINKAVIALHSSGEVSEGHFYQHYFVMLQMCLIPAYALVAWLVFFKRYNFAEYLVILLYNTSILFVIVSCANALKLIFGGFETGYIEICFVLFYNIHTYLNLFDDQNKVGVIARTLLSSLICFAISRAGMMLFTQFLMPDN